MNRLLLTAASVAATLTPALAQPATAQTIAGAGFSGGSAFATQGSGGTTRGLGNATSSLTGVTVHHGDRNRNGRDHRRGDGNLGGFYSDLRDGYDINQGWASDSYNDWWHDRPDRAFPRWLSANQDCQRQYWTGGGWRC